MILQPSESTTLLLQYISNLTCELQVVQQVGPEDVSIQQRTLGHVAFSPKNDLHCRGFLRDWALVELDISQFRQNPENKVYIGHLANKARAMDNSFSESELWLPNYWDEYRFVPIRGIRPDTLTTRKRQAYRVGKCGMTSGLTFGVVSEIEAVLRMPLGDGEQISLALLIISYPRGAYPGPDFSKPGDSGSCIFDFSGRVVGILDGGQSSPRYSEIRKSKYRAGLSAASA